MNLAYSLQVTINGEFVLQKGSGADNIPTTINVRQIAFWPAKTDNAYPAFQKKGVGAGSEYIDVYSEMPIQNIDHIRDDQAIYCYIKTTSSIVFNIEVYGEV